MDFSIGNNRLRIEIGDITKLDTDAIVNAANSSLLGGGGVDGAIHRTAGPKLLEECKRVRKDELHGAPLETGEVVITNGYELAARFVIHTVGPIWDEAERSLQEKQLENCYKNSLRLALDNGLTSIAFPSISTGAFRFPLQLASATALKTVKSFLETNTFGTVVIVLFSENDYAEYERQAEQIFN